jgi:hypothetical protein
VAPQQGVASGEEDETSEIVVVGEAGGGVRLTADSLRDAARAFLRHRPAFAPAAQLYLMVLGDTQTLGFVLRKRRAGRDGVREARELELDSRSLLTLPLDLVQTGQWELRVRGARAAPQIAVVTLSPDSELDDRRFGDIRLQCRVTVAFARLGFATRTLWSAADICGNPRSVIYLGMGRAMSSATIANPAQTLELRPDGMAVHLPVGDPAISNDARVRFVYR